MILVQINWNNSGGLYYVNERIQVKALESMGRENYIKLPKPNTNPRGVELSISAMQELITHPDTLRIVIDWKKEKINFKPLARWIELWQMD